MRVPSALSTPTLPLALGTNVFGWTIGPQESFAVLDAYVEHGGEILDTADVYSAVPGEPGGESEQIIGEWLRRRGRRDDVVLATKAGVDGGLSAANLRAKLDDSLRRLGVDHVDLFYLHIDDGTPLEEPLAVLDEAVAGGKVRHVGASNFSPARLRELLSIAERDGLVRCEAVSNRYNLVQRAEYEAELADVVAEADLLSFPFAGLAAGFLTGKYRDAGVAVDARRSAQAAGFLDVRGRAVLKALDEVAAAHGTTVAAVALAWVRARPTVTAVLASARSPEQLADLLPVATLELHEDEIGRLDAASS